MKLLFYTFSLLLGLPALSQNIDSALLIKDLRTLSADNYEGRKTGTRGNRLAQLYILDQFKQIGLTAYNNTYEYPFYYQRGSTRIMGTNLYGYIPGTLSQVIVITAHYDHLGTFKSASPRDTIYNGADDNASGTAGLLAMARYFKQHPPRYTLVFAALDAEEQGLQGAKAFLLQPPVPIAQMRQNLNMDMIARGDRNELYVCGTYHYPALKKYVDTVAAQAPIRLLTGHDRPSDGSGDWTGQSDHYEFFVKRVPFLYFGVEDHADYHQVTDEFSRINPVFYVRSVRTILQVVEKIDRNL
ncbi:M28 family peptidase [Chitinophaga nivalis]|uniref:M28 family peptidase n=1 Tax=Chitinophaga nivalis TaxID=2991709 RepID=A0ABT3IVC8_9BACT|nr:M28 family peptidase [Chitinophaga nivalis]MCW3462384.1 M28 family peptidase [Chitinophaga nivalis]MCW3487925.1 M28 family peptidase [Chitinophaga nivalis]